MIQAAHSSTPLRIFIQQSLDPALKVYFDLIFDLINFHFSGSSILLWIYCILIAQYSVYARKVCNPLDYNKWDNFYFLT